MRHSYTKTLTIDLFSLLFTHDASVTWKNAQRSVCVRLVILHSSFLLVNSPCLTTAATCRCQIVINDLEVTLPTLNIRIIDMSPIKLTLTLEIHPGNVPDFEQCASIFRRVAA